MGCSSSSVKTAQILSVCRLCDKETNVKWNCLDCKYKMCQNCVENEHSKINNAIKHKIIDVKDEDSQRNGAKRTLLKLKDPQKYKTDLYTIFRLAVDCNNSIWMYDINSQALKRVNINGGMLNIAANFKQDMSGMAAMQPNIFLISSYEESFFLKMYSDKTQQFVDSMYDTSPMKPKSVHVTSDNCVVVGAENQAKKREVVIVFESNGKRKEIYEKGENNKPMFTFTAGITSTHDGHISVIDWLDESGIGQIVVLGRAGCVKNVYTGHPYVNNEDDPFTPSSIIATPSNKIIVTDFRNDTLHVLSSVGFLLTHINTPDLGIMNPYSLALDKMGDLLIGNNPDNEDNATLYRLKIIEN